jgi:mRNA interferase MazF
MFVSTQEPINKEVENLPEPLQQEVCDFTHFLRLKSKGELQLLQEFESWEAASDEDFLKLERSMIEVEWRARGDVLLVSLPPSDRREQSGRRPAIAVQIDQAGEPMLMVAPVTSNLAALRFAFSVRVEPANENGLMTPSVVIVFQMRAIDKARIVRRIGRMSKEDMARIDAEIARMLLPPATE